MFQRIPMIVSRPIGQYLRDDIGHFPVTGIWGWFPVHPPPDPCSAEEPEPHFPRAMRKEHNCLFSHMLIPMEFKSSSQSEPVHRTPRSPNPYQAPVHPPLL